MFKYSFIKALIKFIKQDKNKILEDLRKNGEYSNYVTWFI